MGHRWPASGRARCTAPGANTGDSNRSRRIAAALTFAGARLADDEHRRLVVGVVPHNFPTAVVFGRGRSSTVQIRTCRVWGPRWRTREGPSAVGRRPGSMMSRPVPPMIGLGDASWKG